MKENKKVGTTTFQNQSELERRAQILERLDLLYPDAKSELNFHNPYELVVAVSLSAQCTDKKVNEVTKELFSRFPTFHALSKATTAEIELLINQVNYFRTKAKNIQSMAKKVVEEFSGSLPLTHAELISLPGVGNKTANVVLAELKIIPALAVDTHVFRVSRRLKIARGKNVLQVEQSLKRAFEPKLWRTLHHWLILHGRRVCKAQNPQCERCTLNTLCPIGRRVLARS